MDSAIDDLISETMKLQQTQISEIIKTSGATSAALILIFRLLMQYDSKLAAVFADALERETIKNKQHPSQFHPYYDELLAGLLEIARNPTQRDEKGRPMWIHPVTDDKTKD
jgi:hypothetical protein